jgi:hypothetical protein
MNHMGEREMKPFEKRILGDLKLLLGYRDAGYRTTRGDYYWWLHAAPAIPPQRPQPPPPHQQEDEPITIDDDLPQQQQPPQEEDRPQPPPERLNDVLIMLARNHRAARGQRQISWTSTVSFQMLILNSTSQQLIYISIYIVIFLL